MFSSLTSVESLPRNPGTHCSQYRSRHDPESKHFPRMLNDSTVEQFPDAPGASSQRGRDEHPRTSLAFPRPTPCPLRPAASRGLPKPSRPPQRQQGPGDGRKAMAAYRTSTRPGHALWSLGFGVWGVGFGVWGLRVRVWVESVGFRV